MTTCACRNRGYFRLAEGDIPCGLCNTEQYQSTRRTLQFPADAKRLPRRSGKRRGGR